MLPVIRMTKITEVFKLNCKNPHIIFLSFLALLSGILIGTSYIPYPPWAIAFCYLPLWWAVLLSSDEKSYKTIFFLGWISQFVLTLLGFNWIYFTAREFGDLNIPVSLAALLLFASFMHLYIPFSLVIATYFKRKFKLTTTAFIFTMALVHILLERTWPSIFEWNLGYTLLWAKSPLAQWADTVGFWGLSALIFIFQAILLYSFLNFKTKKTKSLTVLAITVLTVVGLSILGVSKKQTFSKTDSQVKVTIVQANISNEEKLQAEKGYDYQPYVFNTYFDATELELAHINNETDLIIWPETALPVALDKVYHAKPSQQTILNRVKAWQKTLVTGAYSQDTYKRDHLGNLIIRNSVFFINGDGEAAAPYYKTDLLVFGEYMPFGQEMPFLYKLFPFVGVYERGPGPIQKAITLANGQNFTLGPQICYESLNPGFSRGLSKVGAEIFFNLTNDSWFGDWAEPYQHMIMTLARGVENRRPLIRSTNTGISTIILANGEILEQSPIYQKWAHTYTVPFTKNPPPTFYSKYGYWDWALWVLILLFILLVSSERGIRARNKKS
ncbi:apolipoprotein N-acyltransferase [Bdellovibrio sp. qaytius]|nr:apolipoprotein N-acyltransferase [Bdellovibrio sp. qaytius]